MGWDPDPERTRSCAIAGPETDQHPKDRVLAFQLQTQWLTRRTGDYIGAQRSVPRRWSMCVFIPKVAHGTRRRLPRVPDDCGVVGLGLVPVGRGGPWHTEQRGRRWDETRTGEDPRRIAAGRDFTGRGPTSYQLWHGSNSGGNPMPANLETSRW